MSFIARSLAVLVAGLAALPATAQQPGGPPAGARPGGVPGAMAQQPGGAVSRPDGTFRVEGLRPGRYYAKVSSLGRATATTTTIAITPQAPQADLGTISLAQGAVLLEGITATAEASTASFSADRNTYRVRDLPGTAGGNATDVLQNVPSIEVDQDGKVSLRGNQNVAVQINGRPSPVRGDQLANFLQQLPANMIESVEVIPNPSARYEPEGMAGIVNIVLKQNAELGLSGGFTTGAGTGGRYNASGNLGWQRGPLTLFGSYGFRRDARQSSGSNYLETFTPQ